MRDLGWKLKQWFRQLFPIALIGAFLYGGYNLYKAGAFRRGFGPAVTSVLGHVPYFGSRFRHYVPSFSSPRKSYSYQGKSRRSRHGRRASRRTRRSRR